MNEIRLVLYIIMFVIFLVNMISFYRKKTSKTRTSRSVIQGLTSVKTLTSEQKKAVESLYKESLASRMKVYELTGPFSTIELQINNSRTDTVATIGDVVIHWDPRLKDFIKEVNQAEIILPERKKGAIVVSLNGYDVCEEASIQKALKEGKSYTAKREKSSPSSEDNAPGDDLPSGESRRKEAFEFHSGRMVTEEELNWLFRDFRWIGNLLFMALILVSLAIPFLGGSLLSMAGAVLLFLFLILPSRYPWRQAGKVKNLIRIQGTLQGEKGAFKIDRFDLNFPSGWENSLNPGDLVQLEAYQENQGIYSLKVLSMTPGYSIKREEQKNPTVRMDRFILSGILAFAVCAIFFFAQHHAEKILSLSQYYGTRDMPSQFSSLEDLEQQELKRGQYIHISRVHGINSTDSYGTIEIIDPVKARGQNIDELIERINQIEKVQNTYDFANMVSYQLSDYTQSYDFLSQALVLMESENDLSYFTEYFKDSEGFRFLKEIADLLSWAENQDSLDRIPYPEGSLLETRARQQGYTEEDMSIDQFLGYVSEAPLQFLKEQEHLINRQIEEKQQKAFTRRSGILIRAGSLEIQDYSISSGDLEKYNIMPSLFSGGDQFLINESLDAYGILKDFNSFLKQPYQEIEVEGIISRLEYPEGAGNVEITLDTYRTYDHIEWYWFDLFILFLPLLLVGMGFGKFFMVEKKKNSFTL